MTSRMIAVVLGALCSLIPVSAVFAGQWSKFPACEAQFESDRAVCAKVKSQACWASQMERLAWCNRTKGEVGKPKLQTN